MRPKRPRARKDISLGSLFLLGLLAVAAGCASPPSDCGNICSIFAEYPDWYEAARDAERRWGVSIPVMMAIVYQESSFRDDARPPRTWILGFIPGPRPSSAYGYAQALDETWDLYMLKTGKRWAERDDFGDTMDFLGWYCDQSSRLCGISKRDAYHLYLAYHEGHTGFNRRTYRNKTWLLQVALKVRKRAATYARQLSGCRRQLDEEADSGFWFF
ncbi:MAG TPA: hypothetical protein PK636_08110 [bacterium]|mgnify:CR=1 FL=1|nr:hypothetical protein [bacterium]HPJ72633.1 hypothetical protein [bacterium]HPQ66077.1 hypothetical protein [bacterium]